MRIAFFGLPLGALLLVQDGHEIVWAGICRAGAIGIRRLRRTIGSHRVHVVPDAGTDATQQQLRDASPELVVSWFWTKKLPAPVLRMAPSFGIHPSLLPRHRGPDPYFWAIDDGDAETGVTAHRLDEQYDTGPILLQRALRIDPSWDSWRLARALDRPGLALLRELSRAHADRSPPAARAQNEGSATLAPSPTLEQLAVNWSWPAERIERRVRAAAPWPGAWTEIGDDFVTLVRVRPSRNFPRALAPGEAAVRDDGVAVVRAADVAVELLTGRGGDDAPLGVPELAALIGAARTLSIARGLRLRFDGT